MVSLPEQRIHHFNVKDTVSQRSLQGAGGKAFVCTPGTADLLTLTDPDDGFSALSQPVSLTRGTLRFATAKANDSADIHMMAPTGHGISFADMKAQEYNELCIDTGRLDNVMKIPFAWDFPGQTVATEFDSEIDLPVGALVMPLGIGIDVRTLDATETIDAGILTGETGADPNGFLALLSVAALGIVMATLASGGQTLGVLLSADEDGSGNLVPEPHVVVSGGPSISWTLTTGSDTAAGFLLIPYRLTNDISENAF